MAQGTVLVQKYGGSSVADPERIRQVAERIARTRAAGHRLVVVVSAMGDTTDGLLELARGITASPPRRELDMLLTAGERIAMALLSMALQALGIEAISFTGSQSGIITNDAHAGARIVEVRPFRIQDELARGKVVIVAGYQGVSYKREITTLGRGGSDTTAVALAAALGAEYCEICSDVDGVYTGDPRIIDDPRRLTELTPEEMQVLAESGARVLHATAVEYARQQGLVIWARSTASAPEAQGDGTLVRVAGPPLPRRVAGVAAREILLLRTPASGAGAERVRAVEALLAQHGAVAPWVGWAGAEAPVTALVPVDDVHDAAALRAAAEAGLGAGTELVGGLSAVSCVGTRLDADPEILETVLAACEGVAAAVRHLERTSLRITVAVETPRAAPLLRALHEALVG